MGSDWQRVRLSCLFHLAANAQYSWQFECPGYNAGTRCFLMHAEMMNSPIDYQEMEKLQAKGDVDEAELKALEMDVTGKVLLFLTYLIRT